MRGARLTSLLLVALAALATACGASSQTGFSRGALQTSLRALAAGAPHGDRAYWLGPEFNRAPVAFADPAWGHFAVLTYHRVQDVDVDVESFPGRAAPARGAAQVRVRTATGQDVVLDLPLAGAPERRARATPRRLRCSPSRRTCSSRPEANARV